MQFASNPVLQELFCKSLQYCATIFFAGDSISEEVRDSLGFLIDVDCEGDLWTMTRKSLFFARSQPIITMDYMQIRTEKAAQNLEESRSARLRELQKYRTIITQAA